MLRCNLKTESYVKIKVEGNDYLFVVDTGAAISIVKPDKFKARIKSDKFSARGVTGNELKLIGSQTVLVTLGETQIAHMFWVSEIGTPGDGILGVDFLQSVGASVDLEVGHLKVGQQDIVRQRVLANYCLSSLPMRGRKTHRSRTIITLGNAQASFLKSRGPRYQNRINTRRSATRFSCGSRSRPQRNLRETRHGRDRLHCLL